MPRLNPVEIALAVALTACGSADSVVGRSDPPPPAVASVRIVPSTLTLAPGATQRLTAEARQANGDLVSGVTVNWSSSSLSVATVGGDGLVTAIAGGTATVTATAGGRSASASVTVEATYDLDARGVPRFIASDYIELAKIARVSRFRSGIGHDYSDGVERCRSMKHYFQPRGDVDWGAVSTFAPVAGTVTEMRAEASFGTQVQIVPNEQSAMTLIIFHVRPEAALTIGSSVSIGQRLGTHIGSQTMSDIAIRVQTPRGMRFVSYFDAMSDSLFQGYAARGVATRSAMIVSASERDANPLSCVGEQFQGQGALPNWIDLL
jgi:hypothetical protein